MSGILPVSDPKPPEQLIVNQQEQADMETA